MSAYLTRNKTFLTRGERKAIQLNIKNRLFREGPRGMEASYFSDDPDDQAFVEQAEISEHVRNFLCETRISLDILEIMRAPDPSLHYSIIVSVTDMIQHNPSLAVNIMSRASSFMPVLDSCLRFVPLGVSYIYII